ncbi:ABC transporter substrate-binding protein [Paraburkholderia sp.]|uniref:ABC transporter substrate-binding protein n=1 Tax=Paraburkholderia sp. TaxID=1926495 RepID=UPI0039E40EAB
MKIPAKISRFFIALLITGMTPFSQASGNTEVKIAEGSRSFTVMPLYIAISEGYFAEQGLDVNLISMKGGPAAVGALLSGNVDATFSAAETAIKLREQGKNIRVATLIQDKDPGVLVVPTSSMARSLADLKGKRIGVTATGSLTDLILRLYIRREGLTESDFKIIGLGSGATVSAALSHGEIDAAMTVTPFLTKMQLDKSIKVIHDFRTEIYPGQALLVGPELDGPRRALLVKIVAALKKGIQTLYSSPEVVARIARTYFSGMDPSILNAMVLDETQKTPVFSRDGRLSRENYETLVKLLTDSNQITRPEKYEDVVIDLAR